MIKLKDHCSLVSIDDQSLLIDGNTGKYYALSPEASYMVKWLKKGPGISHDALKAKMISEGVDDAAAAHKILDLVGGLKHHQLLESAGRLAGELPRGGSTAIIGMGDVGYGVIIKPKPPPPPPPGEGMTYPPPPPVPPHGPWPKLEVKVMRPMPRAESTTMAMGGEVSYGVIIVPKPPPPPPPGFELEMRALKEPTAQANNPMAIGDEVCYGVIIVPKPPPPPPQMDFMVVREESVF